MRINSCLLVSEAERAWPVLLIFYYLPWTARMPASGTFAVFSTSLLGEARELTFYFIIRLSGMCGALGLTLPPPRRRKEGREEGKRKGEGEREYKD